MRLHKFSPGNFYHIYIHGTEKYPIFRNKKDYERFLALIFCGNGTKPILRLDRTNALSLAWGIREGKINIGDSLVDIISFALMSTHIHFLLKETREKGISSYMHKILTSHSKYFNLKYNRRGRLFESTFHSKFVDTNEYFLYVSSYINKNPRSISQWRGQEDKYPWSSYQDILHKNRWGSLLKSKIITSQFKNINDYKEYSDSILEKEHFDTADSAPS